MFSKRFFRMLAIICVIAPLLAACNHLPFTVTMKDKAKKDASLSLGQP
jgi:hypothetical protein